MHQFNLNKINIGKVERFISPVVLVNILVATASALTGLDGYPDREPLLATQLQLFGFYSLLCLLTVETIKLQRLCLQGLALHCFDHMATKPLPPKV